MSDSKHRYDCEQKCCSIEGSLSEQIAYVSSCPAGVALLTQSMCFPYIQQQGRQCTCYVTLWRVRITIVAV